MCGCGCLSGILGVILPRLVLIGMWIFTPIINNAFNGPLLPALGLLFAPFTVMAYALMHGPSGMTVVGWLVVGVAVIIDVGAITGTGFTNRDKIPEWKKKGFDNP
jgi:hypothetical protein